MKSNHLFQAITNRTQNIINKPYVVYERWTYTRKQLERGEIRRKDVLAKIGSTLGAFALLAVLLFPLYWVIVSAITGAGSLYSPDGFKLLPSEISLTPFVWVIGDLIIPSYNITVSLGGYTAFINTPEITILEASNFGVEHPSDFKKYLWNSILIAVPTLVLGLLFIVPGAYALSRRKFLGRTKLLYGYVLFTQIGGGLGVATLIALYSLFAQAGLLNNKLALSLYYAAGAIPFNTWLLKTYMDGIPTAYEEAALIDGAPLWRIIWEVIIPMSKAGIATVTIFTFLVSWTEFVVAQLLLSPENYTLPVGLYQIMGEYQLPWGQFAAFALLFAAPVTLVYLAAQRYLEGGLSFGGLSG